MSRVFLCGDLHFGHKNITKFRSEYGFADEQDHREAIIENWNNVVTKNDTVYVLGDSVFREELLPEIGKLRGRKILLKGNHCFHNSKRLLEYFFNVEGIIKYKNSWLCHAPIHPRELRGKYCCSGHIHNATIMEPMYRNLSIENTLTFSPVPFLEVINNPQNVLKTYPNLEDEKRYIEEYRLMKEKEKNSEDCS